jgi:phage gpG-like protein
MTLSGLAAYAEQAGKNLAGADWTPALKICRVLLVSAAKECFDQARAPDGSPWLPLKSPRSNSRGKDAPLRDNGLLMGSVTGSGAGHVESLTPTELTVGTNLDYAGVHQFGHTFQRPERQRPYPLKPWVFPGPGGGLVFTRRIKAYSFTVPARPFLGFSESTTEKINRVFQEFIARKL